MSAPELTVSDGRPLDAAAWDGLALKRGNLLQSTLYDGVAAFHRLEPVYFECRGASGLKAGVKLLCWRSRRLKALTGPLSASVLQFGELLWDGATAEEAAAARQQLEPAVEAYCRRQRIVSAKSTGFYGPAEGLLSLQRERAPARLDRFRIAWLELTAGPDQLWAGMHPKHRAEVRKAERAGIRCSEEADVEVLLEL